MDNTQGQWVGELKWAAGFLEGEGWFRCDARKSLLVAGATQNEREPLDRLVALFDGAIALRTPNYRSRPRPIFSWTLVGSKAAGLMMTMYSLMSKRRKGQIQIALDRWKSHRSHHRHWVVCKRGHPLEGENLYVRDDGARRCRTCVLAGARRRDNEKRRGLGAAKRARLTEDQVRLIRQRFAEGVPQKTLCAVFGVAPGTMHHIVHGLTWTHVQ